MPAKKGSNKQKATLIIIIVVIAIIAFLLLTVRTYSSVPRDIGGCFPGQDVTCSNAVLNADGQISVTLSQSIGTLYNVSFACAATGPEIGLPGPGAKIFVNEQSLGIENNTLLVNQEINIKNLQCYGLNNKPLSGGPGTYNGYIWINYTASPGVASVNNPSITARIVALTVGIS